MKNVCQLNLKDDNSMEMHTKFFDTFFVLNNQFLTGDQNLNYVNGTITYLRILLLNIGYVDGVEGPDSSTFQSPGWGL